MGLLTELSSKDPHRWAPIQEVNSLVAQSRLAESQLWLVESQSRMPESQLRMLLEMKAHRCDLAQHAQRLAAPR